MHPLFAAWLLPSCADPATDFDPSCRSRLFAPGPRARPYSFDEAADRRRAAFVAKVCRLLGQDLGYLGKVIGDGCDMRLGIFQGDR